MNWYQNPYLKSKRYPFDERDCNMTLAPCTPHFLPNFYETRLFVLRPRKDINNNNNTSNQTPLIEQNKTKKYSKWSRYEQTKACWNPSRTRACLPNKRNSDWMRSKSLDLSTVLFESRAFSMISTVRTVNRLPFGVVMKRSFMLVIIVTFGHRSELDKRSVFFRHVGQQDLDCAIYGETDVVVAETATFFWSLPGKEGKLLQVNHCSHFGPPQLHFQFDFCSLQPEQLVRILESNPKRELELEVGIWSPQQAVIMATRSHPLNLRLVPAQRAGDGVSIKDDGTELIKALEKRQSSFGTLLMSSRNDEFPFSRTKLERLMNLQIFDKLGVYYPDEDSVLLPFSAKAEALNYELDTSLIQPSDFESLEMTTKVLNLTLFLIETDDVNGLMVSFFNRVAQLGHFERLGITLEHYVLPNDTTTIVQALIGAIKGNPRLTHLNLGNFEFLFFENLHREEIFNAFGERKRLREVTLCPFFPLTFPEDGHDECLVEPYYSSLEQLLSRHRKITVFHKTGEKISNHTTIDKLYALNAFYNGSVKILKESAGIRPLLFTTALVIRAFANVQYTGLLLSQHTDMLCELVDGTTL